MYHDFGEIWKKQVRLGLEEDGVAWDFTTLGTLHATVDNARKVNHSANGHARVVAKESGVWAASGLCRAIEEVSGSAIQSSILVQDGQLLEVGQEVVRWTGDAGSVLRFERTFLNLAAFVSGVATKTRRLVQRVEAKGLGKSPRIVPTRKTLPGYRDLSILGVVIGGGHPHRLGLSGGVLLKENHIQLGGGLEKTIAGVRAVAPHGLRLETEVRNIQELQEAIHLGAEVVLLDNFKPDQVREAVGLIRASNSCPIVEVSGGIDESNIDAYVLEGVDVISLGCLTHSVKSLDLSLLIESA